MNKLILTALFLFLIFCSSAFTQYEVEFNEINGALTKDDKTSADMGRYDGFEIPLFKGEKVNFIVYSDKFIAGLIFVTPTGKIYKQNLSPQNNFTSLITEINEDGNWILYVVGSTNSLGDYTIQFSFAGANAIELRNNKNFCDTFNFIIAHANAYFRLMGNNIGSKNNLARFESSIDASINERDGTYSAKMYEGNNLAEASVVLKDISEKIARCLPEGWTHKSEAWTKIDDYRVQSVLFSEPVNEKERLVLVALQDFSKSKHKFMGNYVVQVIINKNY